MAKEFPVKCGFKYIPISRYNLNVIMLSVLTYRSELITKGVTMSELQRKLGAMAGKMANNKDLISGMMSAVDPKVVANAVNDNKDLLINTMSYLDPEILAGIINSNPDFLGKVMRNLDAAAIAKAMNKNQRFVTQLIENTDPNVFSRSVNVVFNKMRKATYRPGLTITEDTE